MIYLFIDKNQIKALYLKKSVLGQYESSVFSKTYQSDLLQDGKTLQIDFVASATKEALHSLSNGEVKDRKILLILPQESYSFLRIEVPSDIAASAIAAFVKDKARTNLAFNLDECSYDYFIEESATEKFIHFFALENQTLTKFQEALQLIELKIDLVLPESIAYFKLFEKTLRKDKKENILYVSYDKNQLTGFLYDSFGQVLSEKWIEPVNGHRKVEEILKEKALEYEKNGKKLNRLILAGKESENVRQDTFTKEIGVWTNPLKRIIPEFYQEYLKLLAGSSTQSFSVLSYEACIGSFVFNEQNKKFSLLNNRKGGKGNLPSLPSINLPLKEIAIFAFSFIASFIFFVYVSRLNLKMNFAFLQKEQKTTVKVTRVSPTPEPKISPSPTFKKDEVKIKVLNGSGTSGKATEVKTLLKEKGYQEILTGNAESFDYTKTVLQVKKSQSEISSVLKNDLKDNVSSLKESTLPETEAADVVIIIGTDFK